MQPLYSSRPACEIFTERQNNPSHASISLILSKTIQQTRGSHNSILNLSGRGNPHFFQELFNEFSNTTWLVPSQHMLDIAQSNGQNTNITQYAIGSPEDYLESLPQDSVEIAFMKHTFVEIFNLEDFFNNLYSALTTGGSFIANIGNRNTLQSHGSNGSYFVEEELVPKEGLTLEDGQPYSVHFFNEYKKPQSGYIPNAILNFYHYEFDTIQEVAERSGLTVKFFGPYNQFIEVETPTEVHTNLLILTKEN